MESPKRLSFVHRPSLRRGFTLIELLVFMAIMIFLGAMFVTILVVVTRVQLRQSSASEVNQQTQFLTQTIQYYVQNARLVDMTADVATSTLKLRESNLSNDPTYIYLSSSTVYLKVTDGGTPTPLNSGKVTIPSMNFTRHYQIVSSTAIGNESVSYSFTISASSSNPQQTFSQSSQSAAAVLAPVTKIALIQKAMGENNNASITGVSSTYSGANTSGNLLVAVVSSQSNSANPTVADTQGNAWTKIASSGALGTWQTTTPLPVGRRDAVAFVNNGYIYSIGHETANYYAKLNADGSVGAWSTTTNLPVMLFNIAGAVNNGYVYVMGGIPDFATRPTSTVAYAHINADGSLGAWSRTTPLPSRMDFGGSFNEAFVNNGYIYTVGGEFDLAGDGTSTVFYAPINATGSLGAWSRTTPVPDSMVGHSVVFSGGYVYTIGGVNEDNPYYAHVNANGSLGAWSTGTAFPFQVIYESSVVNNGNVYMIGGTPDSGTIPNVYYAPSSPW